MSRPWYLTGKDFYSFIWEVCWLNWWYQQYFSPLGSNLPKLPYSLKSRVAPNLAQYCLRTRSEPGPMLSSPKALPKACPILAQAWAACANNIGPRSSTILLPGMSRLFVATSSYLFELQTHRTVYFFHIIRLPYERDYVIKWQHRYLNLRDRNKCNQKVIVWPNIQSFDINGNCSSHSTV